MGTIQQHSAGVTAKTAASRTIPMENKQKTSFLKLTGVEEGCPRVEIQTFEKEPATGTSEIRGMPCGSDTQTWEEHASGI